jgi:hypothetical protein
VANRKVTRQAKGRRKAKSSPTNRFREQVYGAAVPHSLYEAIENERATLLKARSILGCLKISLESETRLVDGPYYPDIAEIAHELVKQAFNGLDSVNLCNCVARDQMDLGKSAGLEKL